MKIINLHHKLQAQKEHYEKLLALAEKMIETVAHETAVDKINTMLDERERLIDAIKAGDEAIEKMVAKSSGDLFATGEAKQVRDEMVETVQKTKEADELCMKQVTAMMEKIRDELLSLGHGRRVATGYGSGSRPAYANFIDFKH